MACSRVNFTFTFAFVSRTEQKFWRSSQKRRNIKLKVCVCVCVCIYICILEGYYIFQWAGQLSRYSDWLRVGRSGIESRCERDLPPVQTGPGAHPASCKMSTGSFPGEKCGRGVLLTTHPLRMSRSRRVELYLYPPSGPHRACNGITLPLLHLSSQSDWHSRYSNSLRDRRSGDWIPLRARFSLPVQTGPKAPIHLLSLRAPSLSRGKTAGAWWWLSTRF